MLSTLARGPVHPALLAKPVQDQEVELVEHAGGSPFGRAAPTGRWRAAAKLADGQQPPGVEVQAMSTIAAKQAGGEWRGAGLVGGRDGSGSSGLTSRHSSSGTSFQPGSHGRGSCHTKPRERNAV